MAGIAAFEMFAIDQGVQHYTGYSSGVSTGQSLGESAGLGLVTGATVLATGGLASALAPAGGMLAGGGALTAGDVAANVAASVLVGLPAEAANSYILTGEASVSMRGVGMNALFGFAGSFAGPAANALARRFPSLGRPVWGGPLCFLAGTQVETDKGLVSIEDIKPGDRVLSRDEETGDVTYKRVIGLHRGHAEQVCRVTVSSRDRDPATDDRNGEDQQILCTRDHPFYSVTRHGWVEADMLREGELLQAGDGSLSEVVKVARWVERARTFNLEVEDWHTYFVAGSARRQAVMVHNGPGDRPPPPFVWEEGQFYARGSLWPLPNGNNALRMEFRLRATWPDQFGVNHTQRASVSGRQMFGRVLQHFDGHFDRIQAVWGPDLPDNLNLYNVGEILGYPADVSARLTHTGQWAEEAGYRRVTVRPQGPVGNRTYVEADFRGCR